MSLFDRFRKHQACVVQPIEGLKWDGEQLYVKEMNAADTERFLEIHVADDRGKIPIRIISEVVVMHLCDEAGRPIVPEKKREEAAAELVRTFRYMDITEMYVASMKVSGLSQESLEDASKNS